LHELETVVKHEFGRRQQETVFPSVDVRTTQISPAVLEAALTILNEIDVSFAVVFE
jgi:hypothetical protein